MGGVITLCTGPNMCHRKEPFPKDFFLIQNEQTDTSFSELIIAVEIKIQLCIVVYFVLISDSQLHD